MDLSVVTNFLENKNVTAAVSLLLALYAGLAAPALPNVVITFFDTFLGKVLFIFLIAFVASSNVQVAIMLAVAFVVTLNVANKRYAEKFMNIERFENENFNVDEEEDEHEDFDADEEEDENENFDADEEEDENEGFANPHAFSSLDENFENSTELFTDNKKNKKINTGVVPADNLSGNSSKMFAPF